MGLFTTLLHFTGKQKIALRWKPYPPPLLYLLPSDLYTCPTSMVFYIIFILCAKHRNTVAAGVLSLVFRTLGMTRMRKVFTKISTPYLLQFGLIYIHCVK